MKTIIKVFAVISGLVVLVILAALVYLATLNPNDLKPVIAAEFNESTGRTLAIDGDINLTIYPWLGLEVNGLTIGNAAGFGDEPFLQTGHAMARIKLLPLLREQYEIDTVRLHGASIHLVRDEAGRGNWEDLLTTPAAGAEGGQARDLSLAAIVLGGVDVRDASLVYEDRQAGVRQSIADFTVSTGELVYGEPVNLQLAFKATSNSPALDADVNLAATLVYDLDNQIYRITPLQLATTLRGANVPNGSADLGLTGNVVMDLGQETLTIADMAFTAPGTQFSGNVELTDIRSGKPGLSTQMRLGGQDLALLFRVAEIEPLATQLSGLADRSFDVRAAVTADAGKGEIVVENLNASLLGARIEGNVRIDAATTPTPAARGTIKASGPDLPTLMQVLGQLQGGGDSPLTVYGRRFNRLPARAFSVNANFDANMRTGNIDMPVLSVDALGIQIGGNLMARNMQQANGTIDGQIAVSGASPGPLLAALDQAELGDVLKSINLRAGLRGTRSDMAIAPLDLKLVFAGPQISNSPVDLGLVANTRINLDRETVSISDLKLAGLGLNLNGNLEAGNVFTAPTYRGSINLGEFDLRRLLRQLNQEVPPTSDPDVLRKIAVEAEFDGSPTHMNLASLAMVLDDTRLNGRLSVTDLPNATVGFAIDIDRIDADRYLPPASQGEARPVTPETMAGAATQLPLETLRALNGRGDLKIGELTITRMKMSDVSSTFNGRDGRISLAPVSARLYQGSYQGDVNLDATTDQPQLAFKSTLQGVALDPLLLDFMGASNVSGTGNISLDMSTRGVDSTAMIAGLNGSGRFALEDGVLRGVDVAKILAQVEIMIRQRRPMEIDRGTQTAFSDFAGTLAINNGVINSNDMQILAPGLRVTGKGALMNLNTGNINYDLLAAADQATATRGDQTWNVGGYSIPIKCTGAASSPRCVPDIGEIIRNAVQQEVTRQLGNVLQRALGVETPAQSPPPTQQTAPAQQVAPSSQPAQTAPSLVPEETAQPQDSDQAPPQQVDPAQQLLNKALESLFSL